MIDVLSFITKKSLCYLKNAEKSSALDSADICKVSIVSKVSAFIWLAWNY